MKKLISLFAALLVAVGTLAVSSCAKQVMTLGKMLTLDSNNKRGAQLLSFYLIKQHSFFHLI